MPAFILCQRLQCARRSQITTVAGFPAAEGQSGPVSGVANHVGLPSGDFVDWGESKVRLPTEAEWEYAARAGTETMRYWGDGEKEACQYANVADETRDEAGFGWNPPIFACKDGYYWPAPVGRFKPNAFGLYDVLGNVWEWTCSDWGEYTGKNHTKCHEGGSSRVSRGGSWNNDPAYVRSAYRGGGSPGYRGGRLGLRLARTNP